MIASSAPWVIVGCGYTGTRLARVVKARGAEVTITRRDRSAAESAAAELGVRACAADLANPSQWAQVIPPGAIVVCLAPPGSDPAFELRGLLAACADARRVVYVSSTGVYAAAAGAWVDETWPLAPTTPSGHARLAAEAVVRAWPISSVVLRVAGIYGPGRGLGERIRSASYRIVGDGRAHLSRIHVTDLVEVILRAGQSDVTGPINVGDDDPAPIGEVADAIASGLGLPPPPRVAPDTVPIEVAGMLTADRRIANGRMKLALGVTLRYPSWRAAFAAGEL